MKFKVLVGATLALSLVASAASANMVINQTRPPVSGKMVAHAGSPQAAMAGYNILAKGGTAFDAALTMAAAQSFSEALMCHIFGGDLQLILYNAATGQVESYNGTGWAPKSGDLDYYFEKGGIPTEGIEAMHMPGEWSGWMTMLRDHGTMPLAEILAPVVEMAEEGIIVDDFFGHYVGSSLNGMNEAALAVFAPGGQPLKPGDLYKNQDYANLLKTMGEVAASKETLAEGYQAAEDYFYRGPIAEQLVEWNRSEGGHFALEDFSEFRAEKTVPISTNYRGYDVYCTPPNSQGTALIEALNILENYDLKAMGHNSRDYVNVVVQALNIGLNHRNRFGADPRFYQYPADFLTKEFAKEMMAEIDMEKAVTEIPVAYAKYHVDYDKLGPDTTFMFCADQYGNVVAVTHSINGFFGSKLMVPGLGILMNNRLQQYALDPELPNHLEAHKRTVQTITPSIVLKDGAPIMTFGTPNADRQEQTKLQGFLNIVEFGMRPQKAVESPRFATAAPGNTASEGKIARGVHYMPGFPEDVLQQLKDMGYEVIPTNNTGSLGLGLFENGQWTVGADPTRDAYTVAW